MVSFLQISPPRPCIHLSSPPYVLHAPPISLFSKNTTKEIENTITNRHSCYKLDQKMHTIKCCNLETPKCYGPYWPIVRECGWETQSLGHAIISNIRHCGEMVNVWYTEASMYTIVGVAYKLECAHGTKVRNGVVNIFASLYHPLMTSPEFRILEMIAWPSDCFLQLYSMRVGLWGPKHVGVL
jgi:hypothetical protein